MLVILFIFVFLAGTTCYVSALTIIDYKAYELQSLKPMCSFDFELGPEPYNGSCPLIYIAKITRNPVRIFKSDCVAVVSNNGYCNAISNITCLSNIIIPKTFYCWDDIATITSIAELNKSILDSGPILKDRIVIVRVSGILSMVTSIITFMYYHIPSKKTNRLIDTPVSEVSGVSEDGLLVNDN
jgi:hypothetical protein